MIALADLSHTLRRNLDQILDLASKGMIREAVALGEAVSAPLSDAALVSQLEALAGRLGRDDAKLVAVAVERLQRQ